PVAEQLFPQPSRPRSWAQLQPLFIELNDVSPCVDKWERPDRHATFGGDALEATLEPLPRRIIFRTGGQEPLAPLGDLLVRRFSTVSLHPDEQILIRPPGQHPLLKRFRIDLQKIDQVLVEPDRDVVVVLNLTCVPQTNLVDKPPQVGNATEQSLGTSRICLTTHTLSPSATEETVSSFYFTTATYDLV